MATIHPEEDPLARLEMEINPEEARFRRQIAAINQNLADEKEPLDPARARSFIPELNDTMPHTPGKSVYFTGELALAPLNSRGKITITPTPFTKELLVMHGLHLTSVEGSPQLVYSFFCKQDGDYFRAPDPGEKPSHLGLATIDGCRLERRADTKEEVEADLEHLLPEAKAELDDRLRLARSPLQAIQNLGGFSVAHKGVYHDGDLRQQITLLTDYTAYNIQLGNSSPYTVSRSGLFVVAEEGRDYFSLTGLKHSSERVVRPSWIEGVEFMPRIECDDDEYYTNPLVSVPAIIVRECTPVSTSVNDFYRRVALPSSEDVTITQGK